MERGNDGVLGVMVRPIIPVLHYSISPSFLYVANS
jgi:hypothetical protein